MAIRRILIHKSLIDSFKRQALKVMPHEHIVALLGRMVDDDLHICALDSVNIITSTSGPLKITLYYEHPEEEIEAGTNLKYFGTLHSHPNKSLDPSEDDKKDFLNTFNNVEYSEGPHEGEYLPEQIMGIMSVTKKKKVHQYGIQFYNIDFELIDLIISENRPKKG